jgi:hypothetical protein
MDWELSACEMAELTLSNHKPFAVTASKGWAEVGVALKQEADIATGGKKRRRGESDSGWKANETQGMLVAAYCGTGTHVRRQQQQRHFVLASARERSAGWCGKVQSEERI